jgi:hypothetical protein
MKKTTLLLCLFLITLFSSVYADGYLNVITGKTGAMIYIDGELVGESFVKKFPLDEGEHYVRVIYNNKLMYAKMLRIYDEELKTITSEHFVDIKTKTANRGAIDREATRLSETKGHYGLGARYGLNYPASGISAKWLFLDSWGAEISGVAGLPQDNTKETQLGLRLIKTLGNKIFSNTVFSGYASVGYVMVDSNHDTDSTKDFTANNIGVSIGTEFSFADPLYFSIDIGGAFEDKDNNGGSSFNMTLSAATHFYF